MKKCVLAASITAALLTMTAGAVHVAGGVSIDASGVDLAARYPGARTYSENGHVISIYGAAMTQGATIEEAAAKFIAENGGAWGVANLDLRLIRVDTINDGASSVLAYQQYMDGLPVEFGIARVLVRNPVNGSPAVVTYAAARLATEPQGGFAQDEVFAENAMAIVRGNMMYRDLQDWTAPELAVYSGVTTGETTTPATRVWKFQGGNFDLANPRRFTFFVDTATGKLIHARSDIHYTDVSGTVTGKASPGTKPDTASNPAQAEPIPNVRMQITGGNNAYTNTSGAYTVTNGGTTAVTVTSSLANGQWSKIVNTGGAVLTVSGSVTPPGPGNFTFNNTPSGNATGQVNAFIHATETHNYFKSRAPSFTGLDIAITTNTNLAQTCNAYMSGNTINFFAAGGGCVNSAYSTVVNHEYGHFIVFKLGLNQGAFGEGYGDTVAVLIQDTGIVGEDFAGTGAHIRNIDSANKQYPCNGEIHDCGQVIAGCWRDMRLKFGTTLGSAAGLDKARQLQVAWSLVTVGATDPNSASPQTAIEVLTVDDNDGNINNGTPNYDDIKYAFNKHNISVPAVLPVTIAYPNGLPSILTPNTPTDVRVDIIPGGRQPIPGTEALYYRVNGAGSFVATSMTSVGTNQFLATIPGVPCNSFVDYYVYVNTTGGAVVDPTGAPASYNSVTAATGINTYFADDMESGTNGWTVSAGSPSNFGGTWTLVDPVGSAAQPEDDHTPSGTKCWVTAQNSLGGTVDQNDVDKGETILTSPVLNLSGNPNLSYFRWFSNDKSNNPGQDTLTVEVSNDNGASWSNVEVVGPSGAGTSGGWLQHDFSPASILPLTSTMKVRFRVSDLGGDSAVEAAIDDFSIRTFECATCAADFDGSGFLDFDDYNAYVAAFEAGADNADFDGSGFVDFDDFIEYVTAFEVGC